MLLTLSRIITNTSSVMLCLASIKNLQTWRFHKQSGKAVPVPYHSWWTSFPRCRIWTFQVTGCGYWTMLLLDYVINHGKHKGLVRFRCIVTGRGTLVNLISENWKTDLTVPKTTKRELLEHCPWYETQRNFPRTACRVKCCLHGTCNGMQREGHFIFV